MVGSREGVLEQLLDAAAAPCLLLDADQRVLYAHPTTAALVGRASERLDGSPFAALVEPAQADMVGRWLESPTDADRLGPDVRACTLRHVGGAGVPVELRRREVEDGGQRWTCLIVTSTEARGEHDPDGDAARLVHDLNNELSVLVHYGGFVADGLDELEVGAVLDAAPVDRLRAHVEVVRGAIGRAAELTHHLRRALRGGGDGLFAGGAPATAGAAATPGAADSPVPLAGPERAPHVLVADDDDAVRELVVRILRRAGYQVTSVASGDEAVELLAGLEGLVDVVLTDLVMAGTSGLDLDEEIHRLWPGIATAFMSGHSPDDGALRGVVAAGAPLIAKPFSADDLLAGVEEALRRAP